MTGVLPQAELWGQGEAKRLYRSQDASEIATSGRATNEANQHGNEAILPKCTAPGLATEGENPCL